VRLAAVVLVAACGRFDFTPSATDSGTIDLATGDGADGPANLVFVTSTQTIPGSLGDLAGADMICNQLAATSNLPGTYVAWLSTNSVNAKDRLGNARGWVRKDGLPFVDTVADLIAGNLYYPVRLDETGADRGQENDYTVTGTALDGTPPVPDPCGDWTANTGVTAYGIPSAEGASWTRWADTSCGTAWRFYCFGIDHQRSVAPPAPSGRIVFVSNGLFDTSTGLAGADALCTSEASSAGLPGNFRALLAGNGTNATRFIPNDLPWYRVDGVAVTTDFATLTAPMLRTASGSAGATFDFVATGSLDTLTFGTAASTCNNWSTNSSAASGTFGHPQQSITWFGSNTTSCNTPAHLYCFQT
jgi:hypothetical protein